MAPCPVCGKPVRLFAATGVAVHLRDGAPCPGSGEKPIVRLGPIAPVHATPAFTQVGLCLTCSQQDVPLRKDGTLAGHKAGKRHCDGSRKLPVESSARTPGRPLPFKWKRPRKETPKRYWQPKAAWRSTRALPVQHPFRPSRFSEEQEDMLDDITALLIHGEVLRVQRLLAVLLAADLSPEMRGAICSEVAPWASRLNLPQ